MAIQLGFYQNFKTCSPSDLKITKYQKNKNQSISTLKYSS